MTFPPFIPIDPQAEADRLAEERKAASGMAAGGRLTVAAQCTGCAMHGDATGFVYLSRLVQEAQNHAATSGHEVKIDAWAGPAERADD